MATIHVLAGVNGAGKSSIGGAMLKSQNVEVFNPDELAKRILRDNPGMSPSAANGTAWSLGLENLKASIEGRKNYALETTLGGDTITRLLASAADQNIRLSTWYVGLETVDLHLERVAARVQRGGHSIPESAIRKRWDSSRRNLMSLIPQLSSLALFDNSKQATPANGIPPEPTRLLLIKEKKLLFCHEDPDSTPDWAKPIIAAALDSIGS